MDESNGNSNTLPPFLLKTYEMVDEPSTNSVVSWSPSGLSFIVWNSPDFARDLLPKYFKHNNFSSFIRQLNTYGFRKIDPDQWEFANVAFIRGQRHLLKNIYRRKPIHSHSGQTNGAPSLSDREREEFAKMIENLKREKHSLQSEVDRYKYENREYENQLASLGQTLQNIDQRQKQLTITLSQLLQEPTSEPASTSQFIQQTNQNKKRRVLALHYLHHEEEGVNPGDQSVDMDLVEKLDSSLSFWENFMDQIPSDRHHYRYDLNACHNAADDDECCCSLDQMGAGAPDSPPISSICIDLESNDKPSDIITTMDGGAVSSCDPPKPEVNDVFWQQFLTEAPSDSSVTQSDATRDGKKDDGSGVTNYPHKPWWIKCGS